MAGIAAARGGAKTLIVEKDSHLGGTATAIAIKQGKLPKALDGKALKKLLL